MTLPPCAPCTPCEDLNLGVNLVPAPAGPKKTSLVSGSTSSTRRQKCCQLDIVATRMEKLWKASKTVRKALKPPTQEATWASCNELALAPNLVAPEVRWLMKHLGSSGTSHGKIHGWSVCPKSPDEVSNPRCLQIQRASIWVHPFCITLRGVQSAWASRFLPVSPGFPVTTPLGCPTASRGTLLGKLIPRPTTSGSALNRL